jgi:hypothetical protein
MKNSMKIMGLITGAAMFTGAAIAADKFTGAAMAPTPATAEAVSGFVDRYAGHAAFAEVRNTSSVITTSRSTGLTLYPTADREVVFVSFRIGEAEHIALVETHDARVTRFTDFAGIQPKKIPVLAADSGDAQDQAKSILSPTSPAAITTPVSTTPNEPRRSAQQQAADLLQFASVRTDSAQHSHVASRDDQRMIGDGH